MQVTYHPDAEAELREAATYYESQNPGTADRLLREFDALVVQIAAAPERWPIVEGDLRRRVMKRFPYGVYYRVSGDGIRILVVKHHKRHPDYWRYRLDD
jgi:plasmid stabilization system protein ParE